MDWVVNSLCKKLVLWYNGMRRFDMLAVNGYYDGNVCLIEERVSKKPQKVIITFLDDSVQNEERSSSREENLQALKEVQKLYDSATDEAFGLWKNHDNSISVDEYVRNMRKGRKFDI